MLRCDVLKVLCGKNAGRCNGIGGTLLMQIQYLVQVQQTTIYQKSLLNYIWTKEKKKINLKKLSIQTEGQHGVLICRHSSKQGKWLGNLSARFQSVAIGSVQSSVCVCVKAPR